MSADVIVIQLRYCLRWWNVRLYFGYFLAVCISSCL